MTPKRRDPETGQFLSGDRRSRDEAYGDLLARCVMQGDCLVWTGGVTGSDYGAIKVDGKMISVHVFVYTYTTGEAIPAGLVVRHTCDVKLCVRPEHLILGTSKQNAEDAVERQRQVFGPRHYRARFSTEQIEEIRQRAAAGESQRSIARSYGTTQGAVSNIIHRRNRRIA